MDKRIVEFFKSNKYIILLISVFVITYIMFLGGYPLLDVDETRYVTMARDMFQSHDYMTLYLNQDFFFEKPPLFFWIECLAFHIFGGVNEFTARIPIVILSLLPLGLLFKLSKKVKNQEFAFINCAILLTTLEYILITRIAILDSVLTSLVTSSVLCYFYTFFDKRKNLFWFLTYLFMGFAVMAKGIPGIAIPAGTILISTTVFKTYKETLKSLPLGILLLLIIALPWHILMMVKHGGLFFDEYIVKHHLLRFLGSEVIHRNEPVYFYFVTLLWGLFPWIFSLFKIPDIFKIKDDTGKFLTLNVIAIGVILLFFSSSGAKLITYILPVYPFFAVVIGKIWYKYIFEKNINLKTSIVALNVIFMIVLVSAPFVGLFFNPQYLLPIQITSTVIILAYLIFSFIFLKKDNRLNQFLSIVFLMAFITAFISPLAYKLDYSFGQNDLMKFAKLAKENNYSISTYRASRRYSLLYYSGFKKINFHIDDNLVQLRKELVKPCNYLIVRNKDIKDLPDNIKIVERGVKYSIIK